MSARQVTVSGDLRLVIDIVDELCATGPVHPEKKLCVSGTAKGFILTEDQIGT